MDCSDDSPRDGNCAVLKLSEKVPLTMYPVAELMIEAGFPKGVFNIVNGSGEAVNALIDHTVSTEDISLSFKSVT